MMGDRDLNVVLSPLLRDKRAKNRRQASGGAWGCAADFR